MADGLTSTEQKKLAMIQLLDANTLQQLLGAATGPGTDAQRYLAMGGDAASVYQDIMDNLGTSDWQTVSTAAQAKFDKGDYNLDYDTFEGIKKAALDDYAKQKSGGNMKDAISLLSSLGVPELGLIASKAFEPAPEPQNPYAGWSAPILKKAQYDAQFNPERIDPVLAKYKQQLESMPKEIRLEPGSSITLGDTSQGTKDYLNKGNDLVRKMNELMRLKQSQRWQGVASEAYKNAFASVPGVQDVSPVSQYDVLRAQLAKTLLG